MYFESMTLSLPPPGVEVLLLIVLLAAAVYDVRYRRIPNWVSVGGALLGISLNTFLYRGVPGLLFSFKGLALGFTRRLCQLAWAGVGLVILGRSQRRIAA